MTQPSEINYFQHHVFFCLNQREDGQSCCMDNGAQAAFDHMKARVKKLGLNGQDKVRINRAGCFDRCGEGPLLVVYPQAIWYTFVDNDDIDEIIDSHLVHGKVVERLVV
jgi:(2Fe-2S) ferredoxin